MIYYDSHSQVVELDSEVDRGGEAAIYTIKGSHELVAKIYHQRPRQPYDQKLAWMQSHPPLDPSRKSGHTSIAWPVSLLYTARSIQPYQLSGYLMPYIGGMAKLINVINPGLRRKVLPGFDWRYLHRTARNLATAVNALHQYDYVIGDLNESNIMVSPSALVTLIDTDSFQIYNQDQSLLYFCPVGKPEYTPWELQGSDFRRKKREPQADYFALAVIIFQLLMEGSHPYRGRWTGSGDPVTIAEKIQRGLFPYAGNQTINLPPPNTLGIDMLHPRIKELFFQCFIEGQNNPHNRPSPITWTQALKTAELAFTTCLKGHAYPQHLSNCPWCKKVSIQPSPALRLPKNEGEQNPQLSIIQSLIHFGMATPGESCERSLLISNRGKGVLKGSISVKDNWIKSSVAHFELNGGDYSRINLVADISTLEGEGSRNGRLYSTSILVTSNAGDQEVLAQVRVGAPVAVIRPDQIDFGEVEKGEVGTAVLIISNTGNLPLYGRLKTTAPWISIATPEFTCLPGLEAHVVLLAHTHSVQGTLAKATLYFYSKGFRETEVSISAQITVGEAVLGVNQKQVDLEPLAKGDQFETEVWITNDGTGVLRGTVRSNVPWLYTHPATFNCVKGTKTRLVVKMDTAQPGIPLGRDCQEELMIESNGGNQTVFVNFRVGYPLLKACVLSLSRWVRGKRWKGSVPDLVITNDGIAPLKINITHNVPGLCVETTSALIQAGDKEIIGVSIDWGNETPVYVEGDLSIHSNTAVHTISLAADPDQKCWNVIRRLIDLPLDFRTSLSFVSVPASYSEMGVTVDAGISDLPGDGNNINRFYQGEYWICQRPVSGKAYKAFVDAVGYQPPPGWELKGYPEVEEEKAVVGVSWWDAWAFCHWVRAVTGYTVRLPTEAEWINALDSGNMGNSAAPWEWTASLDRLTPYHYGDGRNDLSRPGYRVLNRCIPADGVGEATRQACAVTRHEDDFGFRPVLVLK
jgi:serine/threonine protein kinase